MSETDVELNESEKQLLRQLSTDITKFQQQISFHEQEMLKHQGAAEASQHTLKQILATIIKKYNISDDQKYIVDIDKGVLRLEGEIDAS